MKVLKKYYKYILLCSLCLFIGFLPVILNNNSVLIFNGDDYHQIYQFYLGAWQKIRDGNVSLYDFSIGFGANSFAMVYYLFSPFFLILVFFGKHFIQYSFLYLSILKIIILFSFSLLWSDKVFKHKSSVLLGSFTIAFSGWVFSYLHLFIFLDAFMLFPLALYFIELYLRENKFVGLVLTLSIIGIINYYFMYMFLPFACLYALLRTYELEDNNIKALFKKAMKFVGLCLLSVGIAAFILIPCASMLTNNPRFDNIDSSLFSHLNKRDIFKILSGLFSPTVDHENTSMFIDLNKYQFLGWGGGASIYMFVVTPILLPLVFKLSNKKRKKGIILMFILFAIMIFFKQFWYLLQLNMESRWFYMISFMMAYSVMSVNDEIENNLIDKKNIKFGVIFYLVFSWLFYLISYLMDYSYTLEELFKILIILSLISISYLFYYKKNNKILLVVLLCFEAILSPFLLVNNDKPVSSEITDLALKSDEVMSIIKEDKGFYRVMYNEEYFDDGVNYFRYTTSNTPYSYNYNGLSFYSTIYNSEMEDFLSRLKTNWQMDQRFSSWDLYNLLSTKYIYGHSQLKQIPFGYKLYKKDNDYIIYKNENYIELGFTYDKTINKDSFDKLTYLQQDLLFSDYLIVEDGPNVVYKPKLTEYGNIGNEDDRYFSFEQPITNSNIYVENSTMENTQVDLMFEGNLVYTGYFWQYNYLDFYVDENTFVDMIIVHGNNENLNQDVYLYVKDLSDYDEYFNTRFKESFTDVKVYNNKITSKINVEDNSKWVFTNIGYDKGWRVFVDGKQVETSKVQLGFLGFYIEPGNHTVEFYYATPLLKLGITISVISLIILYIMNKQRIKNV